MKLTVVYTLCYQVGMDTWADKKRTQTIEFTKEQIELLKPIHKGEMISEVIFEEGGAE